MKYFVTDQNDEVQGPHTLDEIRKLLASGGVEKTALVCEEGSETWQPLTSVLPPVPDAVPAPAPVTLGTVAAPPAARAPSTQPPVTPVLRTPEAHEPKSRVNVALVLGIGIALVLIFLGAYFFGRKL